MTLQYKTVRLGVETGRKIYEHSFAHIGMVAEDIAPIIRAIGNHDEVFGVPVSDLAAALILADKSDVRRSRSLMRI